MELNVLDIIKLGRKYSKLWPERIELAQYFKEYRAVQVTRLACKFLPGLALFVFVMQLYFAGLDYCLWNVYIEYACTSFGDFRCKG